MARRSDGSVVAWGLNTNGQCNVPALPAGLTYVQVAAGDYHTVARRSDGSVVAWGRNDTGQCNAPLLPSGMIYLEIAAASNYSVARYGLVGSGIVVGSSCGFGTPKFDCSGPRIGQTAILVLSHARPNASGAVFGSGVPLAPYLLGSGCTVEVDLASAVPLFPVTTNGTGSWGTTVLVPPDPSLIGIQVALQIALFNSPASPGFDLSNGVIATVGY